MNSVAHSALPDGDGVAPWPSPVPRPRSVTALVVLTLVSCVAINGVSVMRYVRNRYHQPKTVTIYDLNREFGSRHPIDEAPALVPSLERPKYDLTLIQKCALLRLSWQHAHQIASRWLVERGHCPRPKAPDFAALTLLGLAERKSNSRLHKLSMAGLRSVGAIGSEVIRAYAIHDSWITSGEWIYAKVHCTCGWSASVRKGNFTQLNAMRAFSQHAANMRANKDTIDVLRAGLGSSPKQSEIA